MSHGHTQGFSAFAASWPVQSRSRSFLGSNQNSGSCFAQSGLHFLEAESEKRDLLSAKRVALSPKVGKCSRVCPESLCRWPRFCEHLRPALRNAGRALGFCGQKKVRPGLRLRGSKKVDLLEILRMGFSIVENVPTPCGIIFKLCTASQLPYRAKSKKSTQHIENPSFTVFSLLDHVGAIPY